MGEEIEKLIVVVVEDAGFKIFYFYVFFFVCFLGLVVSIGGFSSGSYFILFFYSDVGIYIFRESKFLGMMFFGVVFS